ncbi:hypothetical protein ACHAXA_008267 [Cyclostephanos tholiformis]|uniref:N-acetyltransferase domain-containing protein n=1 Tax=Cyclostephanos tholiformis TaxID=382380 RepID=A0ABD3R4U1_9STRA
MAPIGPTHHDVLLPDGTVQRYILRGLSESSSYGGVNNEGIVGVGDAEIMVLDDDDDDDDDVKVEEGGYDDGHDILSWARMCALSFAYKPNPPPMSYFLGHYLNDPRRDASLVRVMTTTTKTTTTTTTTTMASSVRIFRRTLSCGSYGDSSLRFEAGGIGEVCTHPSHRGRGLSSLLMRDALDVMRTLTPNVTCSFLHASADFRRYYGRIGGYAGVTSEWSVVNVMLRRLLRHAVPFVMGRGGDENVNGNDNDVRAHDNSPRNVAARRAEFPRDAPELRRLHAEYSEERFVTIVRSLKYWEEYVSAELGDTLWVLFEVDGIMRTREVGGTVKTSDIVAWLSVRERGDGRYQLREFGTDRGRITTTSALNNLLGAALLDRTEIADMDDVREMVSLSLPSIVLREMKEETKNVDDEANRFSSSSSSSSSPSFVIVDNAKEENDDGWMYVPSLPVCIRGLPKCVRG